MENTALITGESSGIGLELAKYHAQLGNSISTEKNNFKDISAGNGKKLS